MSEIMKRLRDAIKNSDLSQMELERRSGVKQPIISDILNEQKYRKSISMGTIERLADALGLDVMVPKRKRKKKSS